MCGSESGGEAPGNSDVKDQNAASFSIPSYNGEGLVRVTIFRYVYGNMSVSYFCKGVNARGLVSAPEAKNG